MNREFFYKLSISFTRDNPPNISGVYAVFLPDRCVYIGQAINIFNRWYKTSHTRHKQFIFLESLDFEVEYRAIETPMDKLNEVERFWIYCLNPKLNIVKNIDIEPKKDKPSQLATIDFRTIKLIIDSAKTQRDKLIIKTLYLLGLRVSELVNIQWHDFIIQFGKVELKVIGKGNKLRHILVPVELYQSLINQKNHDNYVFISYQNNKLSRQSVNKLLKTITAKLEINSINPHAFRHSHATHSLANGCDISLLMQSLGHSSLKITQQYLSQRDGEGSSSYLAI